jgi:hypothetical protein
VHRWQSYDPWDDVVETISNVSGAAVRLLADSPRVAGLRHLALRHDDVDEDTARELARSPHLAGLGRLVISPNVPQAAQDILRARFGEGMQVE